METVYKFLAMVHKESEGSVHFKVGYYESLIQHLASIPEVRKELENKIKTYEQCQTGA
jgi:hypothetical protein